MKMKTMIALFLAIVCLSAAACAENVPSPSLKAPVVQVMVSAPEKTQTDEETPIAAAQPSVGLVIKEVEVEKMPESTAKLFEQIQQLQIPVALPAAPAADAALTEGETAQEAPVALPQPVKVDLAQLVPQETVAAIAEKLPETSKVEDLVITEFVPLVVDNYTEDLGAVHVQIVSAIEYKPEEKVTALVGVWDGEKMVWFVPELIMDENGMFLQFTAEMLAMMDSGEPVLMMMSDMQLEAQAAAQTL